MTARSAALYHARKRRKALRGYSELFGTHQFAIPTASIAAGAFPVRTTPVTFRTVIEITSATAPTGLIFEFGDSATAIAAWVSTSTIQFRAGDAAAADRGLATFTNGAGQLENTRRFELEFGVIPGTGQVRIWNFGEEIARDTASGANLPNGWAAASAGAFASAASGALPADVTQTGTPTNFAVVEPLRVYVGQVPWRFNTQE